jgi:hypothetical protein
MNVTDRQRNQPGFQETDRLTEETIVVEAGGHDPANPQDVGQEALGMGKLTVKRGLGKLTVKRGIAAGAVQPPGRGRGAHVLPANTKPDGTPLTFFNPAQGTALGTQAAKTSGGSLIVTGGPETKGGGIILSDVLAVDPAPPVFSDRLISDADMGGPVGVVPSGAVNPPR